MVVLLWSKVFQNNRETFVEKPVLIKAAGLQLPYLSQTLTQAIFQGFAEIVTSEQLKKSFPTLQDNIEYYIELHRICNDLVKDLVFP